MDNAKLNSLKAELIEKFAKDGIETTRTVAALVGIDKDFGNGKVAVTYLPLLTIYTTKDKDGSPAFFVQPCGIGEQPKSSVQTKEQVEQWREFRKELFGDAPKGVLRSLARWESRPEVTEYLLSANTLVAMQSITCAAFNRILITVASVPGYGNGFNQPTTTKGV